VDHEGLEPDVEAQLRTISLGDAPKLGEQRIFTNRAVAEAVRNNQLASSLGFQIPHKVVVENRGYEVSDETIRQELTARWKSLCTDCEIVIKNLQLPVISPDFANTPWFIENDEKIPHGYFAQKLIFARTDGRPAIYWVNGQLELRRKVPVLSHSVPGGVRLNSDDYQFEWKDVTYATDTAPDAAQIVGQQTRTMMNAGEIVWRGSLVREKAVLHGEIVRVVVGAGSWQISMQAKTEQDGFIGDTVNMRNLQTNKIISGRVTGRGEVEVE
jgi:flagella basal body P-ring formation protein FlgA